MLTTNNDENCFLFNQTKQSYHTTKSGQSLYVHKCINHKKNNEFILSHA